MKIYISGPITGTNDYMERFALAEHILQANGYETVNPAKKNAVLPTDTSWECYMGESLKMLCECDGIFMLRNHLRSRGATIELLVARQMGKEVYYESDYPG